LSEDPPRPDKDEDAGDQMSESKLLPPLPVEEMEESVAMEKAPDQIELEASTSASGLIPPPGLFKNPKFHKLQIFVSVELYHLARSNSQPYCL